MNKFKTTKHCRATTTQMWDVFAYVFHSLNCKRNFYRLLTSTIALCAVFMPVTQKAQESRQATSLITLKGVSSGGVLTLMKAPALNTPYVSVTNQPGDSAAIVSDRIVRAIQQQGGLFEARRTNGLVTLVLGGGPVGMIEACSDWILGGTEHGFNIPPAPTAVSARYDASSDTVELAWENPSGGYDSIIIIYYGVPEAVLPGNVTHFTHQRRGSGVDAGFSNMDIPVLVMGYKDGVPSNGSGVRLLRQTQLESLMNVPFTSGLAPGFEAWQDKLSANAIKSEQSTLPEMKPATEVRQFEGKGFYQTVGSQGASRGGVARRFIGLNPGHTYRVGARLNLLEAAKDNWTFTMHAAPNPPGGARLSAEQMAGQSDLLNAAKGSSAAQILKLDSNHQARCQWENHSSDETSSNNVAKDIALPAGSDSLTVWFRLEGSNSGKTSVGIDSVTIEDLGIKQ